MTAMEIITAIWAGVAFPAGFFAGFFAHRIRPRPKLASPSSSRERKLRFAYTLDGKRTVDVIPEGLDPVVAAAERSKREGRNYGATRI